MSECTPPSPIPAPPASRRGRRAGRRAGRRTANGRRPASSGRGSRHRRAAFPPSTRQPEQSTTALPRRRRRGSIPATAAMRRSPAPAHHGVAAPRRRGPIPRPAAERAASAPAQQPTAPTQQPTAPANQPTAPTDQPTAPPPSPTPPRYQQAPRGSHLPPYSEPFSAAVGPAGPTASIPAGATPVPGRARVPGRRDPVDRRTDHPADRPAQADGDQGRGVSQPRTDHQGRADLPARGHRRRCRPLRADRADLRGDGQLRGRRRARGRPGQHPVLCRGHRRIDQQGAAVPADHGGAVRGDRPADRAGAGQAATRQADRARRVQLRQGGAGHRHGVEFRLLGALSLRAGHAGAVQVVQRAEGGHHPAGVAARPQPGQEQFPADGVRSAGRRRRRRDRRRACPGRSDPPAR